MIFTAGIETDAILQAVGKNGADGEVYWDVSEVTIKINKVTNFKVNFENLFNGDKVLGKIMHTQFNKPLAIFFQNIKPH